MAWQEAIHRLPDEKERLGSGILAKQGVGRGATWRIPHLWHMILEMGGILRCLMPITLSEKAAGEIKKIVKEQGLPEEGTRLRVGVKGGGCSGFTYVLDLTEEEKTEADEELDSHGVRILCDMTSLLYLDGVEIDFKDELMGRGFVFKNPNATSTCGCGSSYQG